MQVSSSLIRIFRTCPYPTPLKSTPPLYNIVSLLLVFQMYFLVVFKICKRKNQSKNKKRYVLNNFLETKGKTYKKKKTKGEGLRYGFQWRIVWSRDTTYKRFRSPPQTDNQSSKSSELVGMLILHFHAENPN